MIHPFARVVLSKDCKSSIGSSNLSRRSIFEEFMNPTVKSWLLAKPFWTWYDNKCPEPLRFFLMLLLVLPPIYILNGSFHIDLKQHHWIAYSALTYLFYVVLASWWRFRQ
jgi:hypothetical protein